MACHLFSAKPLSEPMLTRFIDTYAALGEDELTGWVIKFKSFRQRTAMSIDNFRKILIENLFLSRNVLEIVKVTRLLVDWNKILG